jgi:hypothetical protein
MRDRHEQPIPARPVALRKAGRKDWFVNCVRHAKGTPKGVGELRTRVHDWCENCVTGRKTASELRN